MRIEGATSESIYLRLEQSPFHSRRFRKKTNVHSLSAAVESVAFWKTFAPISKGGLTTFSRLMSVTKSAIIMVSLLDREALAY